MARRLSDIEWAAFLELRNPETGDIFVRHEHDIYHDRRIVICEKCNEKILDVPSREIQKMEPQDLMFLISQHGCYAGKKGVSENIEPVRKIRV
jgi:hypothetical protein